MSTFSAGLTVATLLIWTGMVLAISFLEAPLKFTVPELTLPVGLAVGRKVFRALNSVELVLSVALIAALVWNSTSSDVLPQLAFGAAIVAIVALAVQLIAIRPALSRRSNEVLAGDGTQASDTRSHAHFYYVGVEVIKLVALILASVIVLIHG